MKVLILGAAGMIGRKLFESIAQSGMFGGKKVDEVLLSDALRLAARAGMDDVAVTLEVVPGVPHVFQGFAAILDEADAALDRAATFLREQLATA